MGLFKPNVIEGQVGKGQHRHLYSSLLVIPSLSSVPDSSPPLFTFHHPLFSPGSDPFINGRGEEGRANFSHGPAIWDPHFKLSFSLSPLHSLFSLPSSILSLPLALPSPPPPPLLSPLSGLLGCSVFFPSSVSQMTPRSLQWSEVVFCTGNTVSFGMQPVSIPYFPSLQLPQRRD